MVQVQHVTAVTSVSFCERGCGAKHALDCNSIVCTEDQLCEMYEFGTAYEFSRGQRLHDPLKFTIDKISAPPFSLPGGCPNTKGSITETHDIRVFSDVDREFFREIRGWRLSIPCGNAMVDTNYATMKQPTFWLTGTVIEQGSFKMRLDWDCCVYPPTIAMTIETVDYRGRPWILVSKRYPGEDNPVSYSERLNDSLQKCGKRPVEKDTFPITPLFP